MSKKIICFGEILWDVFPRERVPGGAPMNVALHLSQLKADVSLISRIGNDQEGKDLLEFIHGFGLSPDHIQRDTDHPTGKVLVDDSNRENIVYDIVKPAAWDRIDFMPGHREMTDQADAFIYGSLSARDKHSRDTLLKLLETPTLKVMDVNLRPPFYSFELLEKLLLQTDILKINEEELYTLADFHRFSGEREGLLQKLTELYDLHLICVTLGKNGALVYHEEETFVHPGYKVEVNDTVGSGDAFLAAFVHSYLLDKPLEHILDDACALGAWVATQKGGTPRYDQEGIDRIKAQ